MSLLNEFSKQMDSAAEQLRRVEELERSTAKAEAVINLNFLLLPSYAFALPVNVMYTHSP